MWEYAVKNVNQSIKREIRNIKRTIIRVLKQFHLLIKQLSIFVNNDLTCEFIMKISIKMYLTVGTF